MKKYIVAGINCFFFKSNVYRLILKFTECEIFYIEDILEN